MEKLGLIGCAACLSCSAYVATATGRERHVAGWGLRLAGRRLRGLCAWLGGLGLVAGALRRASWAALSDELVRRLRTRGVRAARHEACALVLLCLVALSMGVGLSSRSLLGSLSCAVASAVGVELWHASRARARRRALIDEMPEVFRTLAMAMGSGETLLQAIEYVGMHGHGHASEGFAHAALRLRCGASTEEAMAALARELDAPGVELLTTALVIAQRTGSPLRDLFQSSARLVERQGEYERMLAVKTAQVRLSVRIVCLLPLLLVCTLSLISPDFQHGLVTPAGMASVLVAAAMDGCALLIIRRLMSGVI